MNTIDQRLKQGRPILLDGATGTELQSRGVPMNNVAWSGLAVATDPDTDPDVVRQVHLDYIRAGAEVIITNTFAAGRHMLRAAGVENRTQEINRQAARLALQAREEAGEAKSRNRAGEWDAAPTAVWVAGSISPMAGGLGDEARPSPQEMRVDFAEQADLLAESGVDLLILEMMRDIDFSCAALETASATGLPVWVGFSCERGEGGDLKLAPTIQEEIPLAAGVAAVMAEGGSLAAIMHSNVDVTGAALSAIQAVWDGPTGAYPESGYFTMPHWQFVDIIEPQVFADRAMSWIGQGVQLVGGCCGIGTPHIRALAERMQSSAV